MNKEVLSLLDKEHISYYETASNLLIEKVYLGSLYYYKRILDTLLLELYKEDKKNETSIQLFLKDPLYLKINNVSDLLPRDLNNYNFRKIIEKIDDNPTEEDAKELSLSLKYIINEILIHKMEEKNRIEREKSFNEELDKLKEV